MDDKKPGNGEPQPQQVTLTPEQATQALQEAMQFKQRHKQAIPALVQFILTNYSPEEIALDVCCNLLNILTKLKPIGGGALPKEAQQIVNCAQNALEELSRVNSPIFTPARPRIVR